MSIDVPLDESGPEALEQLQMDARNYMNKFDWKFQRAAESLRKNKSIYETTKDSVNLKLAMRQ